MKFGARLLKRVVADVLAEAPPRSPAELDRLARPRFDEARRLLAFKPTLDKLPMEGAVKEFLPAIHLVVENVALDCEQAGAEGDARRAEVREWLQALRAALA